MLLTVLALTISVQSSPPQQHAQTVVRDSSPADSARRRAPVRLPVTATVLASAFHDAAARSLFTRARDAHRRQDSSIMSYDAKVRQRFSVLASIGKLAPDHLVYRSESAARVQWQRGVGARIEMTGNRVGLPAFGSSEMERDAVRDGVTGAEMSPIPYFPGSETLWVGGLAQTEVNDREVVNPIADGAEAYYTYRVGDSVSFKLPDGKVVQLRELDVRPRLPRVNLVVGSLWFDVASGQLVRAAYRLAAPETGGVSVSFSDGSHPSLASKIFSKAVSGLLPSGSAQISAIAVEYGLYEGQFWLPRMQSAEGFAEFAFARVPVQFDNAFDYASVNGRLDLAPIHVDTARNDRGPRLGRPPAGLDSAARRKWQDSARVVYDAAINARTDSTAAGHKLGSLAQCDTAATRVITQNRYDATVPVEVRVPCDLDKLIQSPDLPKSIYGPDDKLFNTADRDALIGDALSMAAQAPISFGHLPPPRAQYGLSMTRYNRVEGISTGLLIDEQIGGGYRASTVGRFGFGDQIPNVELTLERTNLSKTISVSGYRHLVSANDWGDPLSFGSSLSAKLFGRDEGFYYRATGAQISGSSERGMRLDWRVFADNETSATQTHASSFGTTFEPNIAVKNEQFAGGGARVVRSYGDDPQGFRMFTVGRIEGAKGDSLYARGALDVTVSRELFAGLNASVTAAGGTSIGHLPTQRRWFLGGTQTIRGQSADTAQSGNAFWMTRTELARGPAGFRISAFGDIGWTGDRTKMSAVGRPLSGVGIGFSALDEIIRLEVARGLYPRKQTRVLFYLNPRF